MSSDLSINRGLHDDHVEQKSKLQAQHESELKRIRANSARAQNETREAGDAAVNHIKQTTEERIRQIEANGETKVKEASSQSQREYQNLKSRSANVRESNDQAIAAERERGAEIITQLRGNQTRQLEASQAALRDAMKEQQALHQKLQSQSRADYLASQERANREITEQKVANRTVLKEEQQSAQEKIKSTQAQSQATIEEIKKRGAQAQVETKEEQRKRLEAERLEGNRAFLEVREQAKRAYDKTFSEGEKRRTGLDQKQSQELQTSRERYLTTNEKVQNEYSKETQRIQREGDLEVEAKKARIRQNLQQQDATFKSASEERAQLAHQREKEETTLLRAKMENRDKLHDATIKEQESDFQTRLAKTDSVNRSTLGNQREKYLRALYEQQKEFDAKYGRVEARKEDPFYRLQSFEAKIQEADDRYTIYAKVPPHEREKVDIRVKDGKAWLSATRQFSDKRDEEGAKSSMSAYQTWRQEFPLRMPVIRDGVRKEIDNDGNITITIPKRV
jgi:HSP20 family molecular chaperone IbpA